MKKRYLRKDVLRGCVLFAICISLGIGVIGFATYCYGMIDQYRKYLNGILNFSLSMIDGDEIQTCLEEGKISDKLQDEQEMLNQIRNSHEIEYIYIVKPLNLTQKDNMMYILSGVSKEEEGDTDNTQFGDLSGEEFSADVVSHYMQKLEDIGRITYYANRTEFGYMYTGFIAITNSKGEAVAVLSVDVSMGEMTRVFWNFIFITLLGAIVLTSLFLFAMYHWMDKRIVEPLHRMGVSARKFVDDSHLVKEPEELDFASPEVHTGDEVEELAGNLMTMAADLKVYMTQMLTQRLEKERIESELNVATQIQADMLPCIFPPFPDRKEIDIYATMTPAKEVGGDFYDFFMVDETHLAMVMADVSGKGVPAALFMVIGKTLIKDHTYAGRDLGEVFQEVNQLLCESNQEGLFITAFECVLNMVTGELRFVNAGHEKPYILHKGGEYTTYQTDPGFVLALMEEIPYQEGSILLEPGDRLFLHTDGVTEATDANNQLYGSDRLSHALNQNKEKAPKELLLSVREDIDQFVGQAPQFDDLTMLCLEYKMRMKG